MEVINEAILLDSSNNRDEAFTKYVHGVGHLLAAIKFERNHKTKKSMLHMVSGYITRAETIKHVVEKGHHADSAAAAAAAAAQDFTPQESDNDLQEGLMGTMVRSSDLDVTWDDVVGLERAKETIKEAVLLPLLFPQLFTGSRKPWKGILLYGPPGTGKSFLAKAVASESKSTFFSISSSDLISKWQGESERAVKALFDLARSHAPSVIFVDEIDSLAGVRSEGENDSMRRVKTEFLVQMQGVNGSSDGSKRVLVLGATNTPWTLDPAFRRRFEKRIYIPLPNNRARTTMFRDFLAGADHTIDSGDFSRLSELTDGYSGSDISVVLRDALMAPVRKCQRARQFRVEVDGSWAPVTSCAQCSASEVLLPECAACGAKAVKLEDIPDPALLRVPSVTLDDVMASVVSNASSVGGADLTLYSAWTEEFGQEGT